MFDPKLYSESRLPLAQASTLPSHCYTAPEFFRRETETIFDKCWHYVGRQEQFDQPGAYKVIDTIAGSAIVCRDQAEEINAFSNHCRHRGTRLMYNSGVCKGIICPYHAWRYSLNGQLVNAPGMAQSSGFEQDNYPLKRLRLEEFGGFLFVAFSEDVASLSEWIGNLPEVTNSHRLQELCYTDSLHYEINANWKFVIENALEAYHTGTVHSQTLGQQESEPVQATGNWDALYVLNDPDKSIATLPGAKQKLPFIQGLTKKALGGTWFSVIYPCTQIVFSQDCVWWLDIKPISVSKTRLELGASFPASSTRLSGFEDLISPYFERWSLATPEDNAIAEAQQQGHESGQVEPGRLAMTEHCVHKLNNWVLDRILTP